MAAHLVRLKLTLLRNQLRGSIGQVIGLLLSMAFGLLVCLLVVPAVILLRTLPVADAGAWVTAAGALLVLGWAVAPLAALGSDQTLDPARFVTFAIPRRQLVTGLLAGSIVGVPAVVTAVASLGVVVAMSRDVLTTVVALVAASTGFLTCVIANRATGTALTVLQGRRRFREVTVGIGLVLASGVAFVPLMIPAGISRVGDGAARALAAVAALTPSGWASSAPSHAADGVVALAVGKLLLGAALVPVLMWFWGVMLERQLVRPVTSGRATIRARRSLLGVVPGLTGAVAERCLRYWRRDPRYALSLVMVFVLPLLFLLGVVVGWLSLETWALGVAPMIAYFLGWGLHNDLAYDADPWWMHLAAHVPGYADRGGRILASAVWGLPLLLAVAVGGTLLVDRVMMMPAVVGMSVAVAGAGYGVSSVSAVIGPYWAPAPGENPNSTPPGAGGQMFVSQLVASAATALVAAPLAVPFALAWLGSAGASWFTLVAGMAAGVLFTLIGVLVGGRALDRRGPELLARIRK